MTWNDDLRAAMPRDEIPAFLADLQTLVAALRENRPWTLSRTLCNHPGLVLDYLTPGPGRDAVAAALQGQRAQGA